MQRGTRRLPELDVFAIMFKAMLLNVLVVGLLSLNGFSKSGLNLVSSAILAAIAAGSIALITLLCGCSVMYMITARRAYNTYKSLVDRGIPPSLGAVDEIADTAKGWVSQLVIVAIGSIALGAFTAFDCHAKEYVVAVTVYLSLLTALLFGTLFSAAFGFINLCLLSDLMRQNPMRTDPDQGPEEDDSGDEDGGTGGAGSGEPKLLTYSAAVNNLLSVEPVCPDAQLKPRVTSPDAQEADENRSSAQATSTTGSESVPPAASISGSAVEPGAAGQSDQTAVNTDSNNQEAYMSATSSASAPKVQTVLNAAALSWVGTKYENSDGSFRQEDSFWVSPDGKVCVVSDGMGGGGQFLYGGQSGGEIASQITIDVFKRRYQQFPHSGTVEQRQKWLNETIIAADIAVYTQGEYTTVDGTVLTTIPNMGATVVATVQYQEQLLIAWAGDSRVYRLRGNVFQQLTKDHSPKNMGHILFSFVGGGKLAMLIIGETTSDIVSGDKFVIASDGLETLDPDQMAAALNAAPAGKPVDACQQLIDATQTEATELDQVIKMQDPRSRFYQDNVTVIVVEPGQADPGVNPPNQPGATAVTSLLPSGAANTQAA